MKSRLGLYIVLMTSVVAFCAVGITFLLKVVLKYDVPVQVIETTTEQAVQKTYNDKMPVVFSTVFESGDGVYITEYYGSNGGIRLQEGDVRIHHLPENLKTTGHIQSFCIYDDRIYFMSGEQGSDDLPVGIYSSDMNGNDIKQLIDDAENYTDVYIYNGELYYSAFTTEKHNADYYPGYAGGIYKINIDSMEKKVISDVGKSYIDHFDGNTVYYHIIRGIGNYEYYKTDKDGQLHSAADSNSDEFTIEGHFFGNRVYYTKNDTIYVKDKNEYNDEIFHSFVNSPIVVHVSEEYLYFISIIDKNNNLYAPVYRMNRSK